MNEPKITQTQRALSIICGVDVDIRASAAIPSRRLADAKGLPRWNCTVAGIEGQLREGERLRASVPGTDRTFTPTIPVSTDFAMEERCSGLSPLARGASGRNPG